MTNKIISAFMALFMLISSTFAPLKASASEVENKNEIETIMSQESPQENNENLIEESTPSLSEDIDDSEKEKSEINTNEDVINDEISNKEESKPSVDKTEEDKVLEKTETAELYKDSSYNELLDEDFEIKIKGSMPENAIIKAYMVKDPDFNLKEDRENILSFAYEIFDKNGDIYSQLDSSRYEIEIKSNKFTEDNEIYLYEKGVDELEFEENKNFDFYDKKIRFETTKNQFLIQNKVGVQEEEELEDGQVEDGVEEKKDDKNRKSPVYLEQKEQLKETQTNLETNLINKLIDELLNIDDKLSKYEGSDIVASRENLIDSLKVNDSDKKEDNDNSASIIELNKDKRLTYQQVLADIYTDRSYSQKAKDQTRIKLSGNLPGFTKVKAYPVEIKIEGQEVLAAYDITIFDEDNNEYKVTSKNDINVQITNQKIKEAKEVEVYHKENEAAPEEKVDVENKSIDTVSFKADSFSIYAVTDPKAQATRTYEFYVRNKDGSLKLINTQTIRSGQSLQKPVIPILADRGRYAGWFPIGEDKVEHGSNEVHFFTPITFDTKTPVTIKAEPLFLDNAYIDFKERVYITEQNKKDFPIPAGYTLSDDGYYRNNQGEKLYRDEVYKTRVQDFDKPIGEAHIPIIKEEEDGQVLSYWSINPEGGEQFDFKNTSITHDLIRRQEEITGEEQLGKLDLFAIYEDGFTISFDSQGGSHVTRQIVKKGESLNTDKIIDPIKPGYVFKGWSLTPGGEIIDLENRIITQSKTLYAIYDKLPGTYTVSHYTENINDTGFTFYNSETVVEHVGNYTKDGEYFRNPANSEIAKDLVEKGYTVPKSVTPSDKAALVKADGSTNIKVYYRRPRYNLTVYSTGLFQSVPIRQFIAQYKEDEDTKDSWDRMGQILGRYVVREGSLDGPIMKVPPKMPAHDLSLYFLPTRGNEDWYTNYIEVDENDVPIRDENGNLKVIRKTTHNAIIAGWENYVGGDTVEGFEYRYVTKPGQNEDSPKVYTRGQPKEVRTFYKRLSYQLVFKTNNNNYDDRIKTVPYETKIAPLVPTDIKIGDTDKNGATFKGWYDNPQLTGLPVEFTNLTMPAKDTTYFAKWEQQKHNIRIYREMTTPGQVSSPDKIINFQVNRGSMLKRDDAAWNPIKPAKLKGDPNTKLTWYRFSGTEFEEYKFDEPITEDLFLYPVWSYFDPVTQSYRPLEDIHTITYTDGTNSFTDKNLYLNNAAAILQAPYVLGSVDKLEDPENLNNTYFGNLEVPEGKHFQGWLLNNDPSRIYRPGEVINVTSDMTFYAKWGEYDKTSISLYEQKPGTDKSLSKTETIRENGTVILPSPTLQNYNFLGWSKTPNGNVDFKSGQEVMVTNENLPNQLYGIWKVNRTIVINENQPDGSDNTYSRENISNGVIKLIKPAEIKGYRFLGWATEEGAKIPEYEPEAELKVDDNTPLPEKLYGVWQKTQQLTFHNTNRDYTMAYSQNDEVSIDVTYTLNGEPQTYKEKALEIKHNQSVTIDLPAEAENVSYKITPKGYFKVVSVSPKSLEGKLADHYSQGKDNLNVEIVVARDMLRFNANISSIFFPGIRKVDNSSFTDNKYYEDYVKNLMNIYNNNPDALKGFIPQGFEFKGWSKSPDGSEMVDYPDGTKLKDIKENELYAVWSKPKQFKFVVEKDDPTDKTDINFTVELDNYYENKVNFSSNSEKILNTPTASNIKNIIVNNDNYQYEVIGPEETTDDVKFDKYTYIIKIKNNPPVPTGLTDNIAPMAIMLALASMAIAYRLYRKNKLAGGIDEWIRKSWRFFKQS